MNIAPLIPLDKIIDLVKEIWDYFKPIVFVLQYEGGVVFRAGRFYRELPSGNWYLRIPFIDSLHIESIAEDKITIPDVNINTSDNRTISIGGVVEFQIVDVYKAFVATHDWRNNLPEACRGIISDYLEDCTWDEIKLKRTKNAITKKISEKCEEMGVQLNTFTFTDKATSRVFKIVNYNQKIGITE